MTPTAAPDTASEFDRYFFPLKVRLDVHELRAAVETLMARVTPAFERTRQIGLHSFAGSTDPWYDGCRKQSLIGDDRDYTVLHPDLRDTYLGYVFEKALPFQAFRGRLMILEPKTCYAIHRDDTPRYHIAVETTAHARFVFVDRQRLIHVPADGGVYLVDTRETHTAFNGAGVPRIHIVFGGPVPDGNNEASDEL